MSKIIICVGISGSGKSSWSTQFIKDNDNYLRINRDDIRKTLIGDLEGYYQRKDLNKLENLVTIIQEDSLNSILHYNYNVIIDNTHLKQVYIKQLLSEFTNNVTIYFKLFDCDLLDAKKRVYDRDYWILKDITSTDYIDKQYQQYPSIKKWILETYPNNIIT